MATVSYSLRQQCLTAYGNNVLQVMAIMSYKLYGKVGVFPGYLKLLFTLSTLMIFKHRGYIIELLLDGWPFCYSRSNSHSLDCDIIYKTQLLS